MIRKTIANGFFARQGIHINRKRNYKQIRIRRRRFTSINL